MRIPFILFLLILSVIQNLVALSTNSQKYIDDVFLNYFDETLKTEATITELTGGNSNTSLLLKVKGKQYVLRIKDKDATIEWQQRELFAMQEAAKAGIAPQVLCFSKDYRAMLMDYIEGGTVTTAQTKQPENISKLAATVRKAHAIPKNPYFQESIIETAEKFYHEISQQVKNKKELSEALACMWELSDKIEKMNSEKVNIHGELNPRNIFITSQGVFFIDWEYTSWEDPFYDLSYIALFHGYDQKEEMLLLKAYLQKEPSTREVERYYLTKRSNFAQLSIIFHYFSLKSNRDSVVIDAKAPLQPWENYMAVFSEQEADIQWPQFFYDLARCCLQQAKEHDTMAIFEL